MAAPTKPTVIDPSTVPEKKGSGYPEAFREQMRERRKRALGDAAGLDQFGVNLVELPPGSWSAHRHWHSREDEFVYVLKGELVLVTDAGERTLAAGMAAGFPAGAADGHHLVNRSARPARYLEVGTRTSGVDECHYPDLDLFLTKEGVFTDKKGKPY